MMGSTSSIEGIGGGRVAEIKEMLQSQNLQNLNLDAESSSGTDSFASLMQKTFDQVNTNQVQADQAVKELVAGKSKNIHETLLTIERADTSLKLMMQVRNKVLDAYREIMRMQV